MKGFEHQDAMPDVPGPEGLVSDIDIYREHEELILHRCVTNSCEKPIEMRFVTSYNPFKPEKDEPKRYVWLRANGAMPDDPRVHKYLLAYASDFNFLPTTYSHTVRVSPNPNAGHDHRPCDVVSS